MFQNVIAGPHPVDIASLRPKLEIPDELPGVEGWTVGLTTDLGGWPVDRTVEANTIAAAKAFEELGATVEPASFSVTPEEVRLAVFIHFNSIFGSSVKADLDNHRDLLNPATIDFIELGIRSTEGLGYLEGLMLEADIYRRLSADLSRFNVLLCPTLALPAFTAGEHYVDGGPLVNGQKTEHWVDAHFTCVFSVTARCPIVNVPTGFGDNGVPTGMQIVGRTYDDTSVFQAATAYERARPWFQDAQSRPSL
jgi:aspartyl-tRNA(Asn)/glutamyl-tRNA(Gln) amidotransferase subunit A